MIFHGKSLLLLFVVVLLSALLVHSVPAEGGSLSVSPTNAAALVEFSAVIDLDLSGMSGIQGADVALSFDQTVVQVVDADGGAGGVQLFEGDCPHPDFVVLNEADNGSGNIAYAAVSITGQCSGGTLASIQFLCTSVGSSPVTITVSEVSDSDGFLIPHSVANGQVTCTEATDFIHLPFIQRD